MGDFHDFLSISGDSDSSACFPAWHRNGKYQSISDVGIFLYKGNLFISGRDVAGGSDENPAQLGNSPIFSLLGHFAYIFSFIPFSLSYSVVSLVEFSGNDVAKLSYLPIA